MSKQKKIVNAMLVSRGRFFGVETKQGETMNAQFIRETPKYVVIRDRNAQETRKLAKTSLKNLSMGSTKI